jgi:sugar lactone lactonase YvrE
VQFGQIHRRFPLQTSTRLKTFVTRVLAAALALCGVAMAPQSLAAQAVAVPGVIPVGSSAAPVSVTLTVPQGGEVASVQIFGQGSANVDFINAGGSCAGATLGPNGNCTVSVVFSPASPGPRAGAVVLLDSSNHVLASQLLTGSASGSVGVFVPGIINTVAGDYNWIYDGDGAAATSSGIFLPFGIAVNARGDLFIADSNNNRIRKVDAQTRLISTVAGNGTSGSSGDGGLAVNASINTPTSVALDPAGNIYIADSGNAVIRRVDAFTGIISTFAGTLGKAGYAGDHGPATGAMFKSPNGISFDPSGNLYVADTGNNAIRMITPAGIISTVAGNGTAGMAGDGGLATQAQLYAPWSATPIPSSVPGVYAGFYIADQGNHRIRAVDAAGNISTFAGSTAGYGGDGGPATQAQLYEPASVLVDVAGNIYIADSGNNVVRRISATTGVISTYAGNGSEAFAGDGGPASQAGLYGPYAFALDTQGSLYIADVFHNRIRKVDANSAILQYPVMRVNRISAPLTQALENDGNAPLNITQFNAVSNSQLDPNSTTCSEAAPLATLAQCTIGIDFAPTTTGKLVVGEFDVDSNAGNSPGVISLTGQVLNVNPTVATLTSGLNPSTTGTPVTFSVLVTSNGQTPTGTVTLLDGSTAIATGTLGDGGVTNFTISTLTSGSHNLTASYAGDSQNASAVSPVLVQVVKDQQAATTTALSASVSTAPAGAPITFTATVNIVTANAGNGAITGSVAIKQGANTLGVATINNATANGASGVATITLTNLPVGTDSLTAVYEGNSNYAGSTSGPVVETIVLASTKTVLTSAASPSDAGAPLALTATLTSNGAVPTGSVNFLDGTTSLGSAAINAQGVATLPVPGKFWTVGSHSLTAVYNGDANDAGSTSQPLIEAIIIANTTTTLTSSLNPAGLGAAITFNATVTSQGGTPTGTVQFFDNTAAGTVSLGTTTLASSGATTATAAVTTSALSLGTHSITAVYSGDAFDGTSTSAALSQKVQTATIGVTLQSSANPSLYQAPLTFTSKVTGDGSTPTGSVILYDGTTTVGTVTLPANGVASFVNPPLSIGTHTLTATYSGDANHASATSPAVTENILQGTTTAVTASSNSIIAGNSVTLSALVVGSAGQALTGTVNFTDGTKLIATAALSASGAATTTFTPAPGQHVIAAAYSGDANDASSASTSTTVAVTIATTQITFATSANPLNSGSTLTLTSNVTGNGGVPTGTVTFHDGGSVITTVQLTANGTATFALSTLTPGIHQLSASYSGDTNDSPSTSPTIAEQIAQKTSVAITSNDNPSLLQDNVTITITVSNGAPSAPPTGAVTLTDGTTVLATLMLNGSGVATYTMQSPAAGAHSLVASYAGDSANTAANSQTFIQTVNLRPTTTSFDPSITALSAGQPITLISIVQGNGSHPPTGSVTFAAGSTVLGTASVDATGLATLTVTPQQGSYATVAQYSGDSLYAASVSPAISIVVGPTTEFTINLTPPTMSMTSGSHGSMAINITSASTFVDTLAMGCAGLPVDATCTFSTSQVPVSSGTPQSLTVMVDTGDPLGAGTNARLNQPMELSGTEECAIPAGLFLALLIGCNRRRLRRINPRLALFMLLVLLGAGSTVLSGCASDLNTHHTPAGSYTFQIVATGNKTGVTQTATVQLKVTN